LPDKEKAFEILGLKENTNREEIEKRYGMILKKYHLEEKDANQKKSVNIDDVNEAYRILTVDNFKENDEKLQTTYQKILFRVCAGLKIDGKKVENAIHYYKFTALGIIFAITMAVIIVVTIATNVNPDLRLVYIGNYSGKVSEIVVQKIEKSVPEVKKASVRNIPLTLNPKGMDTSENINNRKVLTLIRAQDIDIVIMDMKSFLHFQKMGAFASLDNFKIDKVKNKQLLFKNKKTGMMSFYGVEIENSKFLKDDNIEGNNKIAALVYNGLNIENAKKLLKIILDE